LLLQESARRLGKSTFGQALTPVENNILDASTNGSAGKLNSNEASFASHKFATHSPIPKVEIQFPHFLGASQESGTF